eukprot:358607-Chlamydomonas_euryale.AAC.2
MSMGVGCTRPRGRVPPAPSVAGTGARRRAAGTALRRRAAGTRVTRGADVVAVAAAVAVELSLCRQVTGDAAQKRPGGPPGRGQGGAKRGHAACTGLPIAAEGGCAASEAGCGCCGGLRCMRGRADGDSAAVARRPWAPDKRPEPEARPSSTPLSSPPDRAATRYARYTTRIL